MPEPALTRDVVVIGGGPAGLMAGIAAAQRGRSVAVFEREPESCIRFLLSGAGDAPVSNTGLDVSRFGGRHARFVSDAIAQLPLPALRDWFADHGLKLRNAEHYGHVVAPGGGTAVRDTLLGALEDAGAELYAGVTITRAEAVAGGFALVIDGEPVSANALVLATGPSPTGHALAHGLGHDVAPATPAHAALATDEPWLASVAGLWMDVRATLHAGNRALATREGSLLFQDGAVSGEVVFNLSGLAAGMRDLELELDFYPEQSQEDVAEWLYRALGGGTREFAPAALDRMLPQRLAEAFLRILGVKANARAMHLELKDRQGLLKLMTALRLSITGARDPETRFGGASVRQVDPRTFASRVTPGLYLAGEILDVQPDWGGFGAHFALASGQMAGRHA
ncbi:MAG: aminoacetone oxidase family FAD-binding enzyme [Planctomycetes bacterium]|nr:aminoacetone oxidase family FAD-binding enzyme [Planctomycetota bacterium]MCW8135516.1 aminoacetone oxidase family FAD-binding enzyme [Planctomycetota bacterium]